MSDFVHRNTLTDLWNEILRKHWNYLETEESTIKLEKRKNLEDCLKEFLCSVQHDRKFFLTDTARVLKESVRDLEEFNAQKGINAFESISQYANNLFTKPWRKEFRILKLYSGFYQHEIKSNLLYAEILFEAMGYRRLCEDTLILDGPICPDQVTNVSRDAMTAYVELQIIKHIYAGLDAIGIKCSWLEIYRFREKYTGSASQTVQAIANSFEEKRFRSRENVLMGDNYGYIDVQPSPNYFTTNTQYCPAECQCRLYQQATPVSKQRSVARTNGVCCVPEHDQPSLTTTNLVYSNMSAQNRYQPNHQHHSGQSGENGGALFPQMSHSRSLEHYSEPSKNYSNLLSHRHSFDHQQKGCTGHHYQYHNSQRLKHPQHQNYHQHLKQAPHGFYESAYDVIDGNSLGGSSIISYADVAANSVGINCRLNPSSTYSHPYNVSGNRIPLPLNISNQLCYDNHQPSGYNDLQESAYTQITDQNLYSSISKLPPNCVKTSTSVTYNHPNHHQGIQNSFLITDSLQGQRSQSEQLINFEDPNVLPPTTVHHELDPLYQCRPNYETSISLMDKHLNVRNMRSNPISLSAASSGLQHRVPGKSSTSDDNYIYAKPTPRENRRHALNSQKYPCSGGERGDVTDISYDSVNDDFESLSFKENDHDKNDSPTQPSKNRDGYGSIEYWDNVYQLSQDLGEGKDLLVQSLDLDSLNINNDNSANQSSSAERGKSYSGNENKTILQRQEKQQSEPKQNNRTFENTKFLSKSNSKTETVVFSSSISDIQKQKSSTDNTSNTKKSKSAFKQTNSVSKPNTSKPKTKSNDNKPFPKALNNNNNSSGSSAHHKKSSSTATNTTKRSPSVVSTQIIVTGANEWSCSFCTFLNPDSKHICAMCFHTKDFKMDSSPSSTTAGATTVSHNTPTCA